MKYYNKFGLTKPDSSLIPSLKMQIMEFRCFHCGQYMRVPVEPTYVDWESVAKKYQEFAQSVISEVDQMITDVDAMQPEENPIREYISNKWKILLQDTKKKFG